MELHMVNSTRSKSIGRNLNVENHSDDHWINWWAFEKLSNGYPNSHWNWREDRGSLALTAWIKSGYDLKCWITWPPNGVGLTQSQWNLIISNRFIHFSAIQSLNSLLGWNWKVEIPESVARVGHLILNIQFHIKPKPHNEIFMFWSIEINRRWNIHGDIFNEFSLKSYKETNLMEDIWLWKLYAKRPRDNEQWFMYCC